MKNGEEGPIKGRQFVNDIGGREGENGGRTAFNHSV